MTTFADMMQTLPCAFVNLGLMAGMALLLYAVASAVGNRMPARHAVIPGCVFAAAFAVETIVTGGMRIAGYRHEALYGIYEVFCGLPFAFYVVLLACVALTCAVEVAAIRRWRAGHITPSSVKEAVDRLPQGLRFTDAAGRVVLENLTMGEVDRGPAGDAVWRRSERVIDIGGEEFTQETATDVTAWHSLNEQLQAQVAELRDMQDALVRFQRDMKDLVREREILEAKVAVHDELGHLLLMTERYLANPQGDVDAGRLLALWENALDSLMRGMEGNGGADGDALARALADARDLGVAVRLEETLPEGAVHVELLCRAVRECAANAAKHAGATELTVKAAALDDGAFALSFSNDGAPPRGAVREAGGLRSLRQSVEAAGGTMKVGAEPAFSLRIALPR